MRCHKQAYKVNSSVIQHNIYYNLFRIRLRAPFNKLNLQYLVSYEHSKMNYDTCQRRLKCKGVYYEGCYFGEYEELDR